MNGHDDPERSTLNRSNVFDIADRGRPGRKVPALGNMRRARWLVVVVAVVVAAACGGSSGGGDSGLGATPTTGKVADACAGKKLESTEVGVTPTTITVTVMADVGSPLSPGLFQGSIDAVKAWAEYVNDNGGLACRQVVVKTADSKLSPDEAKNGVTTACGNSLVLLGTTALFLNDMRPVEGCKDKNGLATGIPDLPALQTEPVEQCSPISFAVVQQGTRCPYSGSGVRTFDQTTSPIAWFKAHVADDPARRVRGRVRSAVDDHVADTGVRRVREDRGEARQGVRHERAGDAIAVHAGRAGDQGNQRELGDQRHGFAERREAAQGSRRARRERGQGLGVRAGVLRAELHRPGWRGRRRPIRVVGVPAVRGSGLQPDARHVLEVRQEARQLRSRGVRLRPAAPEGGRRDRGQERPERDHAPRSLRACERFTTSTPAA